MSEMDVNEERFPLNPLFAEATADEVIDYVKAVDALQAGLDDDLLTGLDVTDEARKRLRTRMTIGRLAFKNMIAEGVGTQKPDDNDRERALKIMHVQLQEVRESRGLKPSRGSVPKQAKVPKTDTAPDQSAEESDLMLTEEVALIFRVSPKTVTRWAAAGKLKFIKTVGGHYRFRFSDVISASQKVEPASPFDATSP